MNLIIDVGNSRAKIAVFKEDIILKKRMIENELLKKAFRDFKTEFPTIEKTILSSVSKADFHQKFVSEENILILDASTPLPFKNLYATPETLGNDRKALVAAASKWHKWENTLIIDAGTCLTFDFKNDKNEYLGGAISPGLQMRYRALNAYTANLPLLSHFEAEGLIGNSTKTSMASGVFLGMQKEIEGTIAAYRALYEDLTIIFTGGDAQILSINLKNSIFANSNFLLEGLNYILEFNKSQ
ncbi:MAG TPA: type III pantothenate kinase [Salinimicrobium sp.]|nr:type III pantothenate kinase [Salinimicrobium sp.]